jgi:predicted RNA methylase
MGGWYSSFSKNGAIPGFQFKDKESAQAFQKLVETGDKQDVQSLVVDNKQQDDTEKQKNAANRLKQSADKIISKAQEKLSADRLSNTARRAAQAASMEKTANQSIQLACSMKNIANALDKGQAKHLSGISNTKQVEQINNALKRAAYNERLKKYSTYSERLSHEDEAATSASVEFAESMFPKIYTDSMGEVFEKLDGKRGYASLVKKYKSVFSGKEFYQPSNKSEMDELADMILSADLGSYSMLTMSVERYKRWIGMGIENDSMLRAALREYVQYNAEQPEEDKVKALERAVVGRKVGIDFFPTPKHVATDIVDMADIKPGMRVLEPSAGNGNIAEVIREAGVEPDTIEISNELGEILKAKGFNIVGSDFLESDQKYDRIVMNPPFGNGMDIDHVKHAYDLLLPGGKVVAIMGEGSFSRGDKKATEFRNWLDSVGGTNEKLDENTFTDKSLLATTGANARVVIIEKENQITETALKDSLVFESASDWKEQIRNAHSIDEMVQVARDLLVIENASRSRREYVDTGEKIGGAKKDVWAAILAGQKALDAGDLEGMDSGTANKLVNKKNVTRDTLQSCIDKGADPGAVFLMNKILGSYDVKPGDTDLARESYVKGHALVQEYFQTATSVKDVIDVIHHIQKELTGYNLTPEEKQFKDEFDLRVKAYNKARTEKWAEIVAGFDARGVKFNRDKASSLLYEWEKENKASIVSPEEVSEMNKRVKEWHKREDENPDSKRNLYKALGDKFVNIVKGKSQAFNDNIQKAEEVSDFSFLESSRDGKPREAVKKPKWSRSVPDDVQMTRNTDIVFKPKDLEDIFKIRGIEYGNYVEEESAKHHTQMMGLSFLDLSDLLGISPEKISYNGRLGIRFGSNGSGNASAHYEPSYKAINVTKLRGGGSVAHEWGHFIDNIVHMVSHDGEVKHSFGSDSVSGKQTVAGSAVVPIGEKLPKDIEIAFAEIHKIMTDGNEGRNESKPDDPEFSTYNAGLIMKQVDKLGAQGAMDYYANQTTGGRSKGQYVRKPYYKTDMLQKIADFINFRTGTKVFFGKGKSKFFFNSESWGGDYWTRPHELFARAFEAVINKKMNDRNAKNSYLVFGVDPSEGAPYPDYDELDKLEPAFDRLIALLKENKILERAMEYV